MFRPKLTGWLAKRRSQQERWGEPTAPEQLAERLVGEGADGSAWRMRIEGMHCSHCADAVKRALHEVAGVQTASANADTGRAEVSGESIEPEHLKEAVESLGYDVKGVSVGA
jgi:copper chaperone CopZ